jgi:hypothetical protein
MATAHLTNLKSLLQRTVSSMIPLIAVVSFSLLAPSFAVHAQMPLPKWQERAGGTMAFEVASVRPSEDRDIGNFPLNAENSYRQTGGFDAWNSTAARLVFNEADAPIGS